MQISRKKLEEIVHDEFMKYIAESLNEAPMPAIVDDQPEDEIPDPEAAPEEPLPTDSPVEGPEDADPAADMDASAEPGLDAPPEEADIEDMVPGDEGIAGELVGKTIESVKVDEDSKVMPGATEIVFTFSSTPDPLRILVTKTGKVVYHYQVLHNELGDSSLAPEETPGTEDEADLGDMSMGDVEPIEGEGGDPLGDLGDGEFDDVGPLDDEDMPPEKKEDVLIDPDDNDKDPTSSRRQ